MAILRVRDADGKVTDIPAIRGEKGDSPVKGKDYWTDADKEEIKSFIADAAVPTAIDLSGFESEGKIVETFADGSSKTTTVEFDANGNPVKITDGDGNITTLAW